MEGRDKEKEIEERINSRKTQYIKLKLIENNEVITHELLEEYSCPTNYSAYYMVRTQAFKLIDKNIMRNTYILNPI